MIDVKSPTMSLQPKSLLAVQHENCGENAVSSRSLNLLQPRLPEKNFTKLKLPSKIAKRV